MVLGLGAPCRYAAVMPEARQDHLQCSVQLQCSNQRIRQGQEKQGLRSPLQLGSGDHLHISVQCMLRAGWHCELRGNATA